MTTKYTVIPTRSHDFLSGVSVDDHHDDAHPPESHTGQGATAAELETLTDGSIADTLHNHALFIPANSAFPNAGNAGALGDYGVVILADGVTDNVSFGGRLRFVPSAVDVILVAEATGNMRWEAFADFALIGEVYNLSSGTELATTTAMVINVIHALSIPMFSGETIGDFFGITFQRIGGDAADTIGAEVNVLGLLLTP